MIHLHLFSDLRCGSPVPLVQSDRFAEFMLSLGQTRAASAALRRRADGAAPCARGSKCRPDARLGSASDKTSLGRHLEYRPAIR